MVEPAGESRSSASAPRSPASPASGQGDLIRLLPIALGLLASEDGQYASLKADLRRWAKDDPIDALVATVLGGGIAFYLAERDTNPGCATPWDAILYMATCLSVGYDNLFPTTPTGHALASLVQTFGPALSGMAFDAPAAEARAEAEAAAEAARAEAAEAAAVNRAILARLEDIVRLLGESKR
jgi:voltage-gated potassium channel